jgi:hypothetical protein
MVPGNPLRIEKRHFSAADRDHFMDTEDPLPGIAHIDRNLDGPGILRILGRADVGIGRIGPCKPGTRADCAQRYHCREPDRER